MYGLRIMVPYGGWVEGLGWPFCVGPLQALETPLMARVEA